MLLLFFMMLFPTPPPSHPASSLSLLLVVHCLLGTICVCEPCSSIKYMLRMQEEASNVSKRFYRLSHIQQFKELICGWSEWVCDASSASLECFLWAHLLFTIISLMRGASWCVIDIRVLSFNLYAFEFEMSRENSNSNNNKTIKYSHLLHDKNGLRFDVLRFCDLRLCNFHLFSTHQVHTPSKSNTSNFVIYPRWIGWRSIGAHAMENSTEFLHSNIMKVEWNIQFLGEFFLFSLSMSAKKCPSRKPAVKR